MKSLRAPLSLLALLSVVLGLSACDDDIFDVTWIENRGSAVIYSLSRPELDLPAAYDFLNRRRVAIESPGATGSWDLALDTRDGELVFLAPRALGIESEAGVAVFPGVGFDDVDEAPADSAAYAITEPVPVEAGTVYVFRTREGRGRFSQLCAFFGKLEPTEVDVENQTVSFVFDVNPACDDRGLVPDEERS